MKIVLKRQKEFGAGLLDFYKKSDSYVKGYLAGEKKISANPNVSSEKLLKEQKWNRAKILGSKIGWSEHTTEKARQNYCDSLKGANSAFGTELFRRNVANNFGEKEYSIKDFPKMLPLLAILGGTPAMISSGKEVNPPIEMNTTRQRDSLLNEQILRGTEHTEKVLGMFKDENPVTAVLKIPRLTKEYKSNPSNIKLQKELEEAEKYASSEFQDPTLKSDSDWMNDPKNYKMNMTKSPEFLAIKDRARKRFPKNK